MGVDATRSIALSLANSLQASKQDIENMLDRTIPIKRGDRQTVKEVLLLRDSIIRPDTAKPKSTESWKAPWDVASDMFASLGSTVSNVRRQVDEVVPEVQRLTRSPGFGQMASDIGQGLLSRMGARALRILLREERETNAK